MYLTKEERRKIYITAAAAAGISTGIAAFVITRRILNKKKADKEAVNGTDTAGNAGDTNRPDPGTGTVIEPYEEIAPGVYAVRSKENAADADTDAIAADAPENYAAEDNREPQDTPQTPVSVDLRDSIPDDSISSSESGRKDINLDSLVENPEAKRRYTTL